MLRRQFYLSNCRRIIINNLSRDGCDRKIRNTNIMGLEYEGKYKLPLSLTPQLWAIENAKILTVRNNRMSIEMHNYRFGIITPHWWALRDHSCVAPFKGNLEYVEYKVLHLYYQLIKHYLIKQNNEFIDGYAIKYGVPQGRLAHYSINSNANKK